MSKCITAEEFLALPDAPRIKVPIPELGKDRHAWIHVMSGTERDRWDTEIINSSKDGDVSTENTRAKLMILTVRDDNGQPLFTAANIDALGRKHYALLDRLLEESRRLNRLTTKSMEELEGNSAPGRSEGQS